MTWRTAITIIAIAIVFAVAEVLIRAIEAYKPLPPIETVYIEK